MKYFLSFLHLALLFIFLLIPVSCGKKGELTLKSYEKPEPPTLLNAIHREDKIILQWSYTKKNEIAIENFIILKSSDSVFERIAHVEKNKRSYTDLDFEHGRKYSFKVISVNYKGVYSDDSNIINLIPMDPPLPPKSVSFKTENESLLLTWENQAAGALCNIYKSLDKGIYGLSPVNKIPLSENFFRDDYNVNKPVYYTLRCQNKTGIRDEGHSSEEVAVDPSEFIPSSPKDLKYFTASDRVYLLWKESDEIWVTGYRIYRKIGKDNYTLIGNTQIPTFVDNESPLTKRDYRISAVGPSKESPAAEVKGIVYIPEKNN